LVVRILGAAFVLNLAAVSTSIDVSQPLFAAMATVRQRIPFKFVSPAKAAFSGIYSSRAWDAENPSGPGSRPENSQEYLSLLQNFFSTTKYRTVVDLGCGTWELMKCISIPPSIDYLGVDIVDEMIRENTRRYTRSNVQFKEINSVQDAVALQGDLLIAKDVIQHWSFKDINFFLANVLPRFKTALITNDIARSGTTMNRDITSGDYRALDLTREPFHLPAKVLLTYDSDHVTERVKRVIRWDAAEPSTMAQ
jgi:SAM-dependent methyltransferase